MFRFRVARRELERALENQAALRIQHSFRKLNVRKQMVAFKQNLQTEARKAEAVTTIAAACRGWRARMWFNRDGGREALENQQKESFAAKQRERRAQRVQEDEAVLQASLALTRKRREEQELLKLVFACANPNADIVEWSSHRVRKPTLDRKITKPVKLPPIATIPAQRGGKTDGADAFVPQCQSLEPGLQSVLVTEPTDLLASATTMKHISDRAAFVAAKRLDRKYKGLPTESATMRYALTTTPKVPEDASSSPSPSKSASKTTGQQSPAGRR